MGSYANSLALYEVASLLGAAPWLLVVAIGAIVGLRRLSSQPREGWLVLGAVALAVFGRFGVPTLARMAFQYAFTSGVRNVWMMPVVFELPSAFVQAGVWSLLMLAAFGAERTARSKYLVEDDDADSR